MSGSTGAVHQDGVLEQELVVDAGVEQEVEQGLKEKQPEARKPGEQRR